MKSPDHLKRWLAASGRQWLIFNALDLVDALEWPAGVDRLQQLVASYGEHRSTIATGRTERNPDPTTGQEVEVPVYKGELLEREELDRCVRFLVAQLIAKDPTWKLTNPPL